MCCLKRKVTCLSRNAFLSYQPFRFTYVLLPGPCSKLTWQISSDLLPLQHNAVMLAAHNMRWQVRQPEEGAEQGKSAWCGLPTATIRQLKWVTERDIHLPNSEGHGQQCGLMLKQECFHKLLLTFYYSQTSVGALDWTHFMFQTPEGHIAG